MKKLVKYIIRNNEEPDSLEDFLSEQLHDGIEPAKEWCAKLDGLYPEYAPHRLMPVTITIGV
jgi:hypothetical protein